MTVEMLFPEVTQKIIVVKVALVTKLAERMTFVRPIIIISKASMMTKQGTIVVLPINSEQLQQTSGQSKAARGSIAAVGR